MSTSSRPAVALSLLAAALLSACAGPTSTPAATPVEEAPAFVLSSPDVDADGYLPDSARGNFERLCGDGDNISPNLEWTGVPEGTESFVLIMTDTTYALFTHWVVTGIPGDATSIPAAVDGAVEVGIVGASTRGPADYVGPCRAENVYLYTLYALDSEFVGDSSSTRQDVMPLISDHVLAKAEFEGKRRDVEG